MRTPMASLINDEAGNAELDRTGWEGRRVMGFKLPWWQRPARWTDEQCVTFIESIYMGAELGNIMINSTMDPEFDRILIDGQQRLSAIRRYVDGELAVPGEDGVPVLWTDLEPGEQAHFYRINLGSSVSSYTSEATLLEAYRRHNGGGTPHEPEEIHEQGDFASAEPGYRFR